MIKVCQLRPRLGDVSYNLSLILKEISQSNDEMIIFPELFLLGYPPTDDFNYQELKLEITSSISKIVSLTQSSTRLVIVGTPFFDGAHWRNAALAISNGQIIHRHFKVCLPNYDIFNDTRYFVSGHDVSSFTWKDQRLSLLICEDIWANINQEHYELDPVLALKNQNVDFVIHITASPFEIDKLEQRKKQLIRVVKTLEANVISVNQVGGFNDILFDGQSLLMNKKAIIIDQCPAFVETSQIMTMNEVKPVEAQSRESLILDAITYGLKQYMAHAGFSSVLIGCSGGIDSALVAACAVHALGPKQVVLVTLPSLYNSEETKNDAYKMAENLGCKLIHQSIETYRQQMESDMTKTLSLALSDVTKQNIQSRLRGLMLMTISNQLSSLLLTTGNKSELAMGYATLYGDMNGGLNIIGDLFKTDVVRLANFINQKNHWIPESIIQRPPSAELAPDQRDDDTLPAYDRLDKILEQRIIKEFSLNQLLELNDKQDVYLVLKRLMVNEFKRFQSPPIIKLSSKAFGRGWQFPLIR
tara:strand:+ start:1440 stop:3026 length:1587 start_codon:yes stop_codon:yes gene_type:complete